MDPEIMDLDDELAPQSLLVKNVSARSFTTVFNSVVYAWKPGETKSIMEQKEGKRGPFMEIIVAPPEDVGRGRRRTSSHTVTALGANLNEVWAALKRSVGNPLVRLKGDGKDAAREKWKLEEHSAHALKAARYQVDQWLKRCRDFVAEGVPVPDKPEYVFQAEQDIILFSRNTSEKRFKVKLDGSRWDTREECEAHVRKTPWLAQHSETWKNFVEDMRGDDFLAASNPDQTVALESASSPNERRSATEQVILGPSPAARKIIALALQSGKELHPDLVARFDDPSDATAIEEAMDVIMSPQSKEEKARAKAHNAAKGEAA